MQDNETDTGGRSATAATDPFEQDSSFGSESPSQPPTSASSDSRSRITIPRIRQTTGIKAVSQLAREQDRLRNSHACEPCRHRKIRCSGGMPSCKHCEKHQTACYYTDGKRNRDKRQINEMAIRLEDCEKLLHQTIPYMDSEMQIKISVFLSKATPSSSGSSHDYERQRKDLLSESSEEQAGEQYATARVGSVGSTGYIREDFDKTPISRAVGFVGKASEVAWMQRLEYELRNDLSISEISESERESNEDDFKDRRRIADSAYFSDDIKFDKIEKVNAFDLPPKSVADALLNIYLSTVHPDFPFIFKSVFVNQYNLCYQSSSSHSQRPWLAILNLIFAIAALHSQLTKAEWQKSDEDHLLYVARARQLGLMNIDILIGSATFENVQMLSLFTFYLTASSQINRAWTVAGYAVRIAQVLGMHLLNVSSSLSDVQKEVNLRLWWAIYSLERSLCVMIGRSSSISDWDVNASLPLIADEDNFLSDGKILVEDTTRKFSSKPSTTPTSQPESSLSPSQPRYPTAYTYPFSYPTTKSASSSSYYLRKIHLSILTHSILDQLFAAKAAERSWADVQNTIKSVDTQLKRWRSDLPALFDFEKIQRDQKFYRQRLSLGLQYYSAQMILFRPCLCRVDRRIPKQSAKSKEFNKEGATSCVKAASNLINLIPDEPNSIRLYNISPWWSVLHHLMQAGTVLLLEMTFRAEQGPNDAVMLLQDVKKVMRWLRLMSEDSHTAQRAWHKMSASLQRYAERMNDEISDILDPELSQSMHQNPLAKAARLDTPMLDDNSTSDTITDFEQRNFVYPPLSMIYDQGFPSSQPWSIYDDIDPVTNHYSPYERPRQAYFDPHNDNEQQQPLFQEHHHVRQPSRTSAMFPTSSEMEAMADRERRASAKKRSESKTRVCSQRDEDCNIEDSIE